MCIRFSVMPCNICENCSLKRANSPARRAIRQVQKFSSRGNVEGSYIKKYAFLSPGFHSPVDICGAGGAFARFPTTSCKGCWKDPDGRRF